MERRLTKKTAFIRMRYAVAVVVISFPIMTHGVECNSALPMAMVKSSSRMITNYYLSKKSDRDITESFMFVDSDQVVIRQTSCVDFIIDYDIQLIHYATADKWILDAAYSMLYEIKWVTKYNIKNVLTVIKSIQEKGNWKRGMPIDIIPDHERVEIDIVRDKDNGLGTSLRIRIIIRNKSGSEIN